MKFNQIEFLKRSLERAAFAMHHVKPYANNKEREKNEIRDGIDKIQEALSSITSAGEMFLGMLLDDMKAEDGLKKITDIPIQEVNGTDVFVLDERGDIKQILRTKKPKEGDDWEREVAELNGTLGEPKGEGLIPFCIEELERLNKRLEDYSPSNPEIQELAIQEVVFRLALEMRVQNNVLIMALRALMGKTEK